MSGQSTAATGNTERNPGGSETGIEALVVVASVLKVTAGYLLGEDRARQYLLPAQEGVVRVGGNSGILATVDDVRRLEQRVDGAIEKVREMLVRETPGRGADEWL